MTEHAGAQAQQAEYALGEWLMFRWGLSWPAGNARASARWQDIATLWRGPGSTDTTGGGSSPAPVPLGASLSYKIVLANGQTGMFEGYQPSLAPKFPTLPRPGKTQPLNICQFAFLVEARVANAQLPKAIDAFNGGQAISFGPLTVNSAGVAKNNVLLAWSVIKSVRAGPDFVTVMKKRLLPLPAFVTPVTQVPNYSLFTALVNNILARRPSTPAR